MTSTMLDEPPAGGSAVGEGMLAAVLRSELADALARRGLDDLPVDVLVRGGIVTVRGTVRVRADREAFLAAVQGIQGVRRIDDQLRVAP